MPVVKLTKSIVDSLIRSHEGARVDYRDETLKGFQLRISASNAYYYYKRRTPSRNIKIGSAFDLSPSQAREIAQKHSFAFAEGRDPAGEKLASRQAPTVADLMERYLVDHAEVHKKSYSVYQDRLRIEKIILPEFGKSKVNEITYSDIERFHNRRKHQGNPLYFGLI